MKVRLLKTKQLRGDTIIEVLICIAIVGLVIGGSYALASRSLRQGISAGERTQAVKLAEGQIEALKFRQQNSSNDPPTSVWSNFVTSATTNPKNFCLNTSAAIDENDTSDWMPKKNTGDPNILNVMGTPTPSSPGYEGAFCVTNTQPKYFINISTNPPLSSSSYLTTNPTYLITIRWNAIGGGQNQSQLFYRF